MMDTEAKNVNSLRSDKYVILLSHGSYNPPTFFHLRLFETARDYLHSLGNYKILGGIISPVNNHCGKEQTSNNEKQCLSCVRKSKCQDFSRLCAAKYAPSSRRCKLVDLALQTSDWIRLSSWVGRQNTLKSIFEALQYHQDILNIFLKDPINNNISLEDMQWIPDIIKHRLHPQSVQIILLWNSKYISDLGFTDELPDILGQYGLIVVVQEMEKHLIRFLEEDNVFSKYKHNIHIATESILNNIQAVHIRRAFQGGESVKYLVDDRVLKEIYTNYIQATYCGAYKLADTMKSQLCTREQSTRRSRRRCERDGVGGGGGGGGGGGSGGATDSGSMESAATTTTTPTTTTTTTTTAPSNKGRVILMSCGSYNPPTHMHLRMFERARDHLLKLGTHSVVGGVISPVNDAYGKKDLASGCHRREMLRLALEDSDWIRLSTWELRQPGWTRTCRSLQHHQGLLDAVMRGQVDANRNTIDGEDLEWIPENVRNNDSCDQSPVRIKLLCGGDLLESFATPGLWAEEDIAEIVGHYGLIVITRACSNPSKFIYDSDILSKHSHNIQIVTEWIPNEVSSSRIRRALKRGESVKYLLQDSVIEYVYANGIYGADRPWTIKLDFSSNHSSSEYLDEADDAKYQHDNAYAISSPNDVNMQEPSPCEANAATMTMVALPDSVLQKNLENRSRETRYSDGGSSPASIEDTELAREKFFRSLVNDSFDLGGDSSSSLLPKAPAFERTDSPVELPSSARARNELLAFEDTTESELATLCDNTYSEEREEDVLSVTIEENSEGANDSSVKNNVDCADDNASDRATSEDTTSTTRGGVAIHESLPLDNTEDSDSQATRFEANLEIDGKYIKSLVNSKKASKKSEDGDSLKSPKDEEALPPVANADAKEEPKKEVVKIFQEDISYIKRLRLIINNQPTERSQRHLQGSLDSINLKQATAGETMTKKSKSFESIKRYAAATCKNEEPSYSESVSKVKSDSTSQLVTANDLDIPTEEYCSACCYASVAGTEPASSADVFYTMRSNCSSPDSTECDICSSCNLRDSSDGLECRRGARSPAPAPEPAELCEICGEPATELPQESLPRARPLPKAKSSVEIRSYGASALEEDRFEIDNCGLRDCRLRASLDTCSGPEPLYVNVAPRRPRPEDLPRYAGPKDEVALARSLSVSGAKRLSRKGSYAKRSAAERSQEKRRFSSADNLQNRMSFRASGDKFSKSRESKFMTSADSIRPRVSRTRSLRRSADNVGRLDSSGDNLDSLDEMADTDDNGASGVSGAQGSKCTAVKVRDNDTIKMILTKHGIKIISQKETVL